MVDNSKMSNHPLLPQSVTEKFEVFEWRNAIHILNAVHPNDFAEIVETLEYFVLKKSDIEQGGGNKSSIAKALDEKLLTRGWQERHFDTKRVVDGKSYDTPTHKVDCFKGKIALEVEWNNKDPFFDRDLNNFRLLYDLNVIDVGVIITRSSGRTVTTYGKATTHTDKLIPKIKGGGAGGCPVAVFGISAGAYRDEL